MKFAKSFPIVAACVFGFSVGTAQAEHTRVTNPSAVSLEILGRGFAYSVNFDRVLDDNLAAGIGMGGSVVQSSTTGTDTNLTIPVYANYYFAQEQGSLFATGGVTVFTGGADEGKTKLGGIQLASAVVPNVGLGYENRSDAGFLFRVAGYAMIGDSISPWGGLSIGYSF